MSTKPALRLLLGFTVAMAIGTAMAWHVRGETPAASTQPAQSAPHTVRVERTLVRVAEPVVERPVVERRVVERRVVSRARRVLFGSGRYRPEPFPRGTLLESAR
jgi:hypothetical protein